MMKKGSPFVWMLFVTLSAAFIYQLFLSRTDTVLKYRLGSIDTLLQWRSQHSEKSKRLNDIVIVGVDDETYRLMNHAWPWDRSVFATLLENLQKLGPKIVGFDYIFFGRSQTVSYDQEFADAIKMKKNVIPGGHPFCQIVNLNIVREPVNSEDTLVSNRF